MEARFSYHHHTALLGLSMVPSVLVSLPAEEYTTKNMQLPKMYNDDLPSTDCVESELHCWQLKWQRKWKCQLAYDSLFHSVKSLRHQINDCHHVYLPVTNCSTERSFSGLKRIKTLLRSSMVTLTGLILLHIHRDIPVDISAAIDEFARRHPRRSPISWLT